MSRRPDVYLSITVICILAVASTRAEEPLAKSYAQQARPNVLLIVSEDNGPQLSCYGDPNIKTPHLDKLAEEGMRFEHAFVTHPVCSCSRSSILTGLYPHQNGQIGLATHKYAMFQEFPNIPSILKQQGYRTGIIGKLHVNPAAAFPFDYRWNQGKYISFANRDVRKIADEAEAFMAAADAPFFLMVNYPDAHFPLLRQDNGIPEQPLSAAEVNPLPFVGVDSPRQREGAAAYYNCIRRLDVGVGMLLARLKQSGNASDTLVIYIGDHGAQFSRGKATCYEGGLRIPFIVRWPNKIPARLVRKELVSTIDILPTILDAVGLQPRDDLPGTSLLALAGNQDVAWREYVFAERTAYSASTFFPQRTVRDSRYKLILNPLHGRPNPVYDNYRNAESYFMYGASDAELAAASRNVRAGYATWRNPPQVELYDLKNDPHEFVNLAGKPEMIEIQARLTEALLTWRRATNDAIADPAMLDRLVAEHAQVRMQYPFDEYRSDHAFKWQYLNYLRPPLAEHQ